MADDWASQSRGVASDVDFLILNPFVDVTAYMTNVTGTPSGVAHPRVHISVTILFHVEDSVGCR